jgi:hypothetical protein
MAGHPTTYTVRWEKATECEKFKSQLASVTRETCDGKSPQELLSTTNLIIEPVYPVDTRALVVASKDEEVFRVLDLSPGGGWAIKKGVQDPCALYFGTENKLTL